jgi:hypothetical protein
MAHMKDILVSRDVLADLIRRARELPEMTEDEKNEQRASWAYGQMACMSRYANATPEQLDALRAMCRKAAGCK